MDRRTIIITAAVALIVAEGVLADMMPVCQLDTDTERVSGGCDQAERRGASSYGLFDRGCSITDLSLSSISPLPETRADGGTGRATQLALTLTERSSSFDYCLYALLGLGLCYSGHWVRWSSLDLVPQWYHDGGPFQIGHSLAVSPKTLCSEPVCCFVQPDFTVEDSLAPSRWRRVVPFWRESQFTPNVLAARGPPVTC